MSGNTSVANRTVWSADLTKAWQAQTYQPDFIGEFVAGIQLGLWLFGLIRQNAGPASQAPEPARQCIFEYFAMPCMRREYTTPSGSYTIWNSAYDWDSIVNQYSGWKESNHFQHWGNTQFKNFWIAKSSFEELAYSQWAEIRYNTGDCVNFMSVACGNGVMGSNSGNALKVTADAMTHVYVQYVAANGGGIERCGPDGSGVRMTKSMRASFYFNTAAFSCPDNDVGCASRNMNFVVHGNYPVLDKGGYTGKFYPNQWC